MTVKMRMSRWRCTNGDCERLTFADRPSESVSPYARRTGRIAELVHLFGHGVGGKPGERLLKRLGMPVSDDTILRSAAGTADWLRAHPEVEIISRAR